MENFSYLFDQKNELFLDGSLLSQKDFPQQIFLEKNPFLKNKTNTKEEFLKTPENLKDALLVRIVKYPDPKDFVKWAEIFITTNTRSFSRNVKNKYNRTCLFSVYPNGNPVSHNLVAHHLDSTANGKGLEFNYLNCIPISTPAHKAYHKLYSNYTSPESFIKFLMLIKENPSKFNFLVNLTDLDRAADWVSYITFHLNLQIERKLSTKKEEDL